MKKLLAFCLAALLLAGAASAATPLPATAVAAEPVADSMDAALTAVTLKVKECLGISDDYTEFSGDYDDYLAGQWYLRWLRDEEELSVTANTEGKVMEVYVYRYEEQNDYFYGFDPAFPSRKRAQTEAAAQAWLARLLGEGETARIDSYSVTLHDGEEYRFSGTVLLNGLPSPISFNLRLGGELELLRYNRSDSYGGYVGEVPAAQAAADKATAAEELAAQAALELYWVVDDGEASLRYVPQWDSFAVLAESGECVNLTELYESFSTRGDGVMYEQAMAAEAPAAGNADAGLTAVELESIENYANALTSAELDAKLRAMAALGLDEGFELQNSDYRLDSESGAVTASLRYTKTMTEDELYGYSKAAFREREEWDGDMRISKYITLDAKSGALQSVSTSYPIWEVDEARNLSTEALTAAAEGFLAEAAPERYAATERCTLSDYAGRWVWARVEQGYFVPSNHLSLELNAATATVDSFYQNWDEELTFGSTDILDEDEALAAYTQGMDFVLGYIAWPEELHERHELYEVYSSWGYTWVESLRLAWYYADRADVTAVDAVTGELLRSDGDSRSYVYSDLEGCPQRAQIEALAEAGIGIEGGRFEPEALLTQRTALVLLEQADGNLSAADWSDEALKESAVYQGFIAAEDWNPDAPLSRLDFIKMIINVSRYADAAKLRGVWQTSLDDADELDAAETAYAALAEALGMVSGALRPQESCTRAEAADILSGFMR